MIGAILRQKSGVRKHRTALLYANDGTGMGWFSARSAARETVLTEAWLVLASPALEGRLVRAQVSRANRRAGTVFAPWDTGTRVHRRRGKWLTMVEMADDALADLGWTLTTDVPHWGEAWNMPPGRQEMDAPLAEVDPTRMRAGAEGTTFLQAAQGKGWHWVRQFLTDEGDWAPCPEDVGESGSVLWRRIQGCMGRERGPPPNQWLRTEAEGGALRPAPERVWDYGRWCARREDEVQLPETPPAGGEFGERGRWVMMTSDGSLRNGRAGFAMRSVEGASIGVASRLGGSQQIYTAELMGGLTQLRAVWPSIRAGEVSGMVGWIDNQGVVAALRSAPTTPLRRILRGPPGSFNLLAVGYMMRQAQGKVQWEWLKSHTYRRGAVYDAHTQADREAGEATLLPQREPVRWARGDVDFVLRDERGRRVEGDPRKAIRRRMGCRWWEEPGARDGRSWGQLQRMNQRQRALLAVDLANGRDARTQREVLMAMSLEWGLRGEWAPEGEQGCRLCALEEPEGDHPVETLRHVVSGGCSERMGLSMTETHGRWIQRWQWRPLRI